jgi:ABC-type multidrug transport system ATPase subunit
LLLEVTHLTKTYGAVTALSDVSLSVRRGEVLGLIGPNGAGKTTLFECIAGVLPRDAGQVRLDGEAEAFYLPDAITPWPSQPVRWALRFTQKFFGGAESIRDEVVERLGLESLLDQPMRTLSKGQRKRALLAVGLLTPHALLLADEPFEGLDVRQTREIAALLRAHVARGRTLFLSIHQIADAARVCDRFVLLSAGRVCGAGTLAELSARARVQNAGATGLDLEEVFLALT